MQAPLPTSLLFGGSKPLIFYVQAGSPNMPTGLTVDAPTNHELTEIHLGYEDNPTLTLACP